MEKETFWNKKKTFAVAATVVRIRESAKHFFLCMCCVAFCAHASQHPDKCDGERGRRMCPELEEATTGSRQGEIGGGLKALKGPLKWKWRKLQRLTGTNQLPGFRRLPASTAAAALTQPSLALPLFFPFVGDIVIYVQEPFSLRPLVGWAIIHPGPAARGTHRNKSAGQDLWLAHAGHCFCLVFCFCECVFFVFFCPWDFFPSRLLFEL